MKRKKTVQHSKKRRVWWFHLEHLFIHSKKKNFFFLFITHASIEWMNDMSISFECFIFNIYLCLPDIFVWMSTKKTNYSYRNLFSIILVTFWTTKMYPWNKYPNYNDDDGDEKKQKKELFFSMNKLKLLGLSFLMMMMIITIINNYRL